MFLFRFISCEGGFVQSELVCIVFLSYDLVNVDSVATAIFSFFIFDLGCAMERVLREACKYRGLILIKYVTSARENIASSRWANKVGKPLGKHVGHALDGELGIVARVKSCWSVLSVLMSLSYSPVRAARASLMRATKSRRRSRVRSSYMRAILTREQDRKKTERG